VVSQTIRMSFLKQKFLQNINIIENKVNRIKLQKIKQAITKAVHFTFKILAKQYNLSYLIINSIWIKHIIEDNEISN
jgi:hypothetical protein